MLSQWLGWKFSIDDHRGGGGSGCCCKVIFLLLYIPTPILFLARTCRTALGHYTPPRHYHHRGREPWIMIAWALAGGRTGTAVWLAPDKCVWFTATGRLVFQKWLYYTGPREEIDRERTRERETSARREKKHARANRALVECCWWRWLWRWRWVAMVVVGLMAKTKFADRPNGFIAGLHNQTRPIQWR